MMMITPHSGYLGLMGGQTHRWSAFKASSTHYRLIELSRTQARSGARRHEGGVLSLHLD